MQKSRARGLPGRLMESSEVTLTMQADSNVWNQPHEDECPIGLDELFIFLINTFLN